MTEHEVQMVVEEAYRQFASMVIASTSAAGMSARTGAVIAKTLRDLRDRLREDPEYVPGIVQRALEAEPVPQR